VVVWAILREKGRTGVRARIEHDNDLARHLARLANAHPHLEVLAEPTLSICCFRYVHGVATDLDAVNATILRRLLQETPFLPSGTIVDGQFGLRPCFINFRSEFSHVEGLVDAVVRLGAEITSATARRASP
jgi:aromatic-L-amino-acid decarboxylase